MRVGLRYMAAFGLGWCLSTLSYGSTGPCPKDLGDIGLAISSQHHLRDRLYPFFLTPGHTLNHPDAHKIAKTGKLPPGISRIVRALSQWRVIIEDHQLIVFQHPPEDRLFVKDGTVQQVMGFDPKTPLHPHGVSEIMRLPQYPGAPHGLALGSRNEVIILNILTGDIIQTFVTEHPIRAVALHPDYLFVITTHHIELFSLISQKTHHVVHKAKDRITFIPPVSSFTSGTVKGRPVLFLGSDQHIYGFGVIPASETLEQLFVRPQADPITDLALIQTSAFTDNPQIQPTLVVRTQNGTHATLETFSLQNTDSPLQPHLQTSHLLPPRHQFPVLTLLTFGSEGLSPQSNRRVLLVADPLFQKGVLLPLDATRGSRESQPYPLPLQDPGPIFELTPLHDMSRRQ